MMTATKAELKTERCQKIIAELTKMKVGMCGVKFDCLVWKVTATTFAVGSRSVTLDEDTWNTAEAADLIYDLQGR